MEIFGYIPIPGQQVSEIWWNIAITVEFQSQVHRVTFFSCLKFLRHKNTEKHYPVIISSYWARGSEPQIFSRE